jgi:hypothetical protein
MVSGNIVGCEDPADREARKKEEAQAAAIKVYNEKIENVNKAIAGSYRMYLDGNESQARQGLSAIVPIIKGAGLSLKDEAHYLWLAYSRRYVLEMRGGRELVAKEALLKSRYWALEELEADGLPAEDAISRIEAVTAEANIIEFVDRLDNSATGGRGLRVKPTTKAYPANEKDRR